jgi:hypothetical protein
MLALAAERAMEDRFLWRGILPRSGRKRGCAERTRLSYLDLGGQDIPILIAECLRDQL